MTNQPPELRRFKAQLILSKLSPPLRSDVLANGSIAESFDLEIAEPVRLSHDIVLRRNELFAAFRQAADGDTPMPLHTLHGDASEATVSIEPCGGAGMVTIGTERWGFANAALLASSREGRLVALEHSLAEHTLTDRDKDWLRELVGQSELSDENFFAVATMLASSPESFAQRLRERLNTERISKDDLLPKDPKHWENIITPLKKSSNLTDFITNELENEWRARLSVDAGIAFISISLTFASPALVPRSLFDGVDSDTLIGALETACGFDDHFGLAGAFVICADRVDKDARFVELGEKLLDRLFGDMDHLQTACQIFAAAFVVATAHLAEHDLLKRYPPFWRRLAAASHASLVVRSCGMGEAKQDGLYAWAMHVSGETYLLSVLNDFAIESRWRPEWIADHFLIANIFGRVLTVFNNIPDEHAPESWRTRLDATEGWIEQNHLELLVPFPAVLEGSLRAATPSFAALGDLVDLYRRLADQPTTDHFMRLFGAIQVFGFPPEARDDTLKAVEALRSQTESLDDWRMQIALALAAHIAAQYKDVEFADTVAEVCLQKVHLAKERQTITEAVCRLVECAAANPDRSAAWSILTQRLETLALILPEADMLAKLVELLESLKEVEPAMTSLLGRALAAARLGGYRLVAA